LPEPAYFLPQPEEGRAIQLVCRGDRRDRLVHALVDRDDEGPFFAFLDANDVGWCREGNHLADVLFGDLHPKPAWYRRLGVLLLGGLHRHEEERGAEPWVN